MEIRDPYEEGRASCDVKVESSIKLEIKIEELEYPYQVNPENVQDNGETDHNYCILDDHEKSDSTELLKRLEEIETTSTSVDDLGHVEETYIVRDKCGFQKFRLGEKLFKYKCLTCGYLLTNRFGMKQHVLKMHCQGSFICIDCRLPFQAQKLLDYHICSSVPKPTGPNGEFVVEKKWMYIKIEDKSGTAEDLETFKCLTCGHLLHRHSLMFKHIVRSHRNGTFSCTGCGYAYPTGTQLRRHICTAPPKKLSKQTPKIVSTSTMAETEGVKTVFNGPYCYVCDTCGARRMDKRNIQAHIKLLHSEDEAKYTFERCKRT